MPRFIAKLGSKYVEWSTICDGRYIYYANARGKTAWNETYSNGKTTTTIPMSVETAGDGGGKP